MNMINKIIIDSIPDICWEYNSTRMKINRVTKSRKRFVYEQFYGEIPEHHSVIRNCGNNKCINPTHLFIKPNQLNYDIKTKLEMKIKKEKNGCWNWTGNKNRGGYGVIQYKDERRAHRVSYIIHKGEIPEGKCVCHTCDNPACVNPKHLWIGSHSDNMKDAYEKGRVTIPTTNYKLDENKVREIRKLAATMTRREIAEKYGVAKDTIRDVITGRNWKHVK